MSMKMQLKYDKYWGYVANMNKLIYIGVVVDPRYKFAFISYYFREEYGELEGSNLAGDVKSALFRLYEHYQSLHQPQTQSQSQTSVSIQEKDVAFLHPMKKVKYSRSDKYIRQMAESGDEALTNDLEIYINEKTLTKESDDFDILK
ncbi:hypothetical protein C2S52_008459 [Perilla frutescens var. hirtella]|nr:hypothetical protein C2S52_008459 [Perilla frutescens var. hirtella]